MVMRHEYGHREQVENQIGPFGQSKLLTAAGGADLNTTAVMVPIPKGVAGLDLIPRNFGTATNYWSVGWCPYLSVFKSVDAGVTFSDFSEELQDGDSGTVVFSSLDTFANGDFVYIGTPYPIRGLRVDVDGSHPNGTNSVMTVKYWKNDSTWADITATDGTASTGKTLAQDGDITWTVPSTWVKSRIYGRELYWLRVEVSAALDSDTLVANMYGLAESSAHPNYASTYALFAVVDRSWHGHAAVEVLANADDGFLIVNGYSPNGRRIG